MGSRKARIPLKMAGIFFRQLSVSQNSGISLRSTLETRVQLQRHRAIKKLAGDILDNLSAGGNISDVMGSRSLPDSIPFIVRVGEETGRLDDAFEAAASICEFNDRLRTRIISALVYPIFLLLFGFLVLPLPNLVSKGFPSYIQAIQTPFLFLLALTGLIYLIFEILKSGTSPGTMLRRLILKLPLIGPVQRKLSVARFAHVLSVGISAGLDFTRAVRLAGDACGNPFIQNKVYDIVEVLIGGGDSLADQLGRCGEFPDFFCTMIATGERSGKLEEMLESAAKINTEEALTAIDRLLKLLGPVVFIIIALYFGYQIVRFWTGYFSAIGQLNRPF
ncbi:type II secretion system F family protein [bacterium]|nr:type II secretion system F family protein [candidate division CSSED10-310 bacterium]